MVTEKTKHARQINTFHRAFARSMRHMPTDAEKKFWWQVRDRRLAGFKFKRQYLVGPYIADFVCLDRKLIVELDGGQHAQQASYDRQREAFLRSRGFCVMRFWNDEVLTNMDGVIEGILLTLEGPPHLNPLPDRGRGQASGASAGEEENKH
ncbi:MAG: endonuclease domain-containing protein [Alphaproteobacteria bacterium]|nr:endonuclease domain-containing protein [Alphaproteobacteria bacterium]